MNIELDQKAPKFKLFDTEKNPHYLLDYRGRKLIILFFPFAFSSTCTKEMCTMRDDYSFYEKSGVDIIGISTDSIYTLAKWKADNKFDFTLLSDYNKEVSKMYDALYEEWNYGYKGVSKRASFVIDKEGIIRHKEILENASDFPNIEMINQVLGKI